MAHAIPIRRRMAAHALPVPSVRPLEDALLVLLGGAVTLIVTVFAAAIILSGGIMTIGIIAVAALVGTVGAIIDRKVDTR